MNKLTVIATMLIVLMASMANAVDITIFDGQQGGGSSWYDTTDENNEVEPGMARSQGWDLESFALNGSILTMVGGFDSVHGISGSVADLGVENNWDAGDIFIDIDGNCLYGDALLSPRPITDATLAAAVGDTIDASVFGYEYVIDIEWDNANDYSEVTYNVYNLNDESTYLVYFDTNRGSNPWRLVATDATPIGTPSQSLLSYGYQDDFEGRHYSTSFDLGFLNGPGIDVTDLYVHTTMECGNDSMMGHSPTWGVPDGGATLALLGLAILGLAGIRRRVK